MNNVSYVLLGILVVFIFYVLYKKYSTSKWETLLQTSQQTKGVSILEKTNFRPHYSLLSIFAVVFLISLFPISQPVTLSETEFLNQIVEENIPFLNDMSNKDVYLVTIESQGIYDYVDVNQNQLETLNVITYHSNYSEIELYSNNLTTSNNVFTNTVQLVPTNLEGYVYTTEIQPLEYNKTYLVVGAYYSSADTAEVNDDRIKNESFIYPWNFYEIIGYNHDLPLEEQSLFVKQQIIELLEEINK